MEHPTHVFREISLMFQLIQELGIKSKNVMSWSPRKKKECLFCSKDIFLTFAFYFNV